MLILKKFTFEELWNEIKRSISQMYFFPQVWSSHKAFITAQIYDVEAKQKSSLLSYLIEHLKDKPQELISGFEILHYFSYCSTRSHYNREPLSQICQLSHPLPILELLFKKINEGKRFFPLLKITDKPPYADISDNQLFSFLLQNYRVYSNAPLLYWPIINEDIDLLNRILSFMPTELIDMRIMKDSTPLMLAVLNAKEKIIPELLKYGADVYQTNQSKQNLAHFACSSSNESWILKLLNDSTYKDLQIAEMLFDLRAIDINHYSPCAFLFEKGHYSALSVILKKAPYLRQDLLICFKSAFQTNNVEKLKHLIEIFEIDIFAKEQHGFLMHLIERFFNNLSLEMYSWFLNHSDMDSNLFHALKIYHAALEKKWSQVDELFQNVSINWHEYSTFIPFAITRLLLIENQTHFFTQYHLFDLHPHFHQILDNRNQIRTFFDFISIKEQPNYFKDRPEFSQYFLDYLERHLHEFPQWAHSYHFNLEYVLAHFPLDKNMFIQGKPLLHFLIDIYDQYDDWLSEIKKFIDSSVDVNAFDSSGKHLFAQLILNKHHGFKTIQILKKEFPGFRLEKLDTDESNLLHLAIEKQNFDCLSWCLFKNQSVDVCAQRLSDGKTPLEMSFDIKNPELVDEMRKRVKKNQFITFLKTLIQKNSHDLISYLLQFVEPFGWSFTTHHHNEIRKLQYPEMNQRWIPAPSKIIKEESAPPLPAPAPIPKTKNISSDALIDILKKGHIKKLEALMEKEYHESLLRLFNDENHLIHFLFLAFSNSNKKINKIFIRVPIVQALIKNNTPWGHLFIEAIEKQESTVIVNMLERENIRQFLASNKLIYLEKLLTHHSEWFFENKHSFFELNNQEMIEIIHLFLEKSQIKVLANLFKSHTMHQILPLLSQQIIFKLMLIPEISKQPLIGYIKDCYSDALLKNDWNVCHQIHQDPHLNEEFSKILYEMIEVLNSENVPYILPIWQKYLTQDELQRVFKLALQMPHETLVNAFLDNPKLAKILEPQAFELIQTGLEHHPKLFTHVLLKKLSANLNSWHMFDYIRTFEHQEPFLYFMVYTTSQAFINTLTALNWFKLLVNENVTQNLMREPILIERIKPYIHELLIMGLNESRNSIIELIEQHSSLKALIIANAYYLVRKSPAKGIKYLESRTLNHDWHQIYYYALVANDSHICEAILSHPNIELNSQKIFEMFIEFLSHQNINAIQTLEKYFPVDTFFTNPGIDSDIVRIFSQALNLEKFNICESILKQESFRVLLRQSSRNIIEAAQESGRFSDLISLWETYEPDLKSTILPYKVANTVLLPNLIFNWMTSLRNNHHVCYLVGSAIHLLLKNKQTQLHLLNDIDFISSTPPIYAKTGMVQSMVQSKLFFTTDNITNKKSKKKIKIECFVNSTANPKHFIMEDIQNRDFTVNSLYADEQGHVYDPTGYGLSDFRGGVIRTITADPLECFNTDPIRLIRALKLMLKGFHLCDSTREAILNWEANMVINFGHLYAMCNTLFHLKSGHQLFQLMRDFHLIRKLLHCDENLSFDEIKEYVKTEATRHKFSQLI